MYTFSTPEELCFPISRSMYPKKFSIFIFYRSCAIDCWPREKKKMKAAALIHNKTNWIILEVNHYHKQPGSQTAFPRREEELNFLWEFSPLSAVCCSRWVKKVIKFLGSIWAHQVRIPMEIFFNNPNKQKHI